MAGVKITDLESLANAEDSDFLIIIDHSGLETKKISRGEFLREVDIDSSEILSLIDSDYLKSIIDEGYIQSHANENYIKSLADQDYIRSFVDSDYVALKAPPIPDFGLMDFTAGQNVFAGDVRERLPKAGELHVADGENVEHGAVRGEEFGRVR